jgi:hypothetical protein
VQLLSSLDHCLSDNSDVLNLVLDDTNVLGDSLDVGLQLFGFLGQRFNLGSDVLFLAGEFFLLVLDHLGEFLLNFDGSLINFLTGINTLVSLTLEFLSKLILNIFNLMVNVGDLLLNLSGLLSDDVLGDSLCLNLLLNKRNSLISLLSDSRRSLLLNLRLVNLGCLLVDDILSGLILNDLIGFFTDSLLFDSFLVLDVLVFDFSFSSQS